MVPDPAKCNIRVLSALTFSAQVQTMIERRPIPRHNDRIGTIAFVGGAVNCGIHNISPFGAALDVASTILIPHEITLLLRLVLPAT